jgi:hypothetical protein
MTSSKSTFVGFLPNNLSIYSGLLFVVWQNRDPSCFTLSAIILTLIHRLGIEGCAHVCCEIAD